MSDAVPRIGFVGLSHLGICSAAAAASRGFDVIAVDPLADQSTVARLQRGEPPVEEPDLTAILSADSTPIRFDTDLSRLSDRNVIYLSADVSTDSFGVADLSTIDQLLVRTLSELPSDCALVVLSQVPPGYTRRINAPPSQLFYQVETLIFGEAIQRALNPERYIVGATSAEQSLPAAYAAFLGAFNCPILQMNYESAELAKISINMFLAASIGVSNSLADVAARVGADWSEITPALRLDKRIGQHAYLSAGLGISGGNIERDMATIDRLAAEVGADVGVVRAIQRDAIRRRSWAFEQLTRRLPDTKSGSIGVLGLAYKANTNSTKNSAALELVARLRSLVKWVYDPAVETGLIGLQHVTAADPISACDGVDAVAIMTPWPEFSALDPATIARQMRGNLVIDPYRLIDRPSAASVGLNVVTIGLGESIANAH